MSVWKASLPCAVLLLLGIANASPAGRPFLGMTGLSIRVPHFDPWIEETNAHCVSEKRQISVKNLGLRGGVTTPVNEEDAALLKGKTIVFVSAGYEAKKAILDIAHARGVNTIVFDEPTSWASPTNPKTLDKDGQIHKFIAMDMNRAGKE